MLNVLRRAADWVGGALFLLLFIVFLIQIAARFIFNKPLPWTDEAAVVVYVWVIVWASALMVKDKDQVAFDLIWNAVSRNTRRVMKIVGHLLIGGLSLVAIPANWDYVKFMARENTPVLDIPFMWVFMPFVVLLVMLVVRSALGIYDAVRGVDLDAGVQLS